MTKLLLSAISYNFGKVILRYGDKHNSKAGTVLCSASYSLQGETDYFPRLFCSFSLLITIIHLLEFLFYHGPIILALQTVSETSPPKGSPVSTYLIRAKGSPFEPICSV